MALHAQSVAFLREIASLPASHTIEPHDLRKLVAGTAISDTFELASTEDRWVSGPMVICYCESIGL